MTLRRRDWLRLAVLGLLVCGQAVRARLNPRNFLGADRP